MNVELLEEFAKELFRGWETPGENPYINQEQRLRIRALLRRADHGSRDDEPRRDSARAAASTDDD